MTEPQDDASGWEPMRPIERAMARRMAAAAQVPLAAQWTDVSLDAAQEMVRELKDSGVPATLTAVMLHAVAPSLLEQPSLYASVDLEGFRRRVPATVNIGVAVASPRGLVVPVVRDVASLSLEQVCEQLNAVVEAVRSGDNRQELFSGGTFSVTNIGAMGLTGGLPLPNPPQVAILGVSSTRRAPVVIDETIQIRTIATLTLALDHRCVEGMASARFLAATRQRLEAVGAPESSSN
jgi:pyruvate dehydrogenase E2 component (dihydrolipoamide acetyltransferase)